MERVSGACFIPLIMSSNAVAIVTVVLQPYKDSFKLYNKGYVFMMLFMMLLLAFHFLGIVLVNNIQTNLYLINIHKIGQWMGGTLVLITFLALLYISIIILHKLY